MNQIIITVVLFIIFHSCLYSSILVTAQEGPTSQSIASDFRKQGDKALNDLQYDQAIDFYSKAITADSEDYQNFYKRAAVYLLRGKSYNALQDLNVVLAKKPDFLQAKIRRGKVYIALGRFAEAKQEFTDVLKQKPDDEISLKQLAIIEASESSLNSARDAITMGRYQDAITELTSYIEKVPDSIEARLMRARAYLQKKDYNLVIDDTMRVLKMRSNNVDALFLRGRSFYFLGQNEAAINHLREALKYDPDNTECKNEFKRLKQLEKSLKDGADLLAQGRHQEALTEFITAEELDVGNQFSLPNIYTSQCDCYHKLRKYKSAIQTCTKALDIEFKMEALLLRAESHIGDENYDAALADFQSAHSKDQTNQKAREGIHRVNKLLKMAKRKNYYAILGVEKDAPSSEIRKAFRKLAIEFHPDKHENKELAETKMIEINEAYEVLSDDDKRRRYDSGEDLNDNHFEGGGFPGGFPFGGGGGPFTFHFNFGGR